MKKINIAIIGCGHWGPNYIRVFHYIKNTSVRYICDLDRGKLKKIKEKYPWINGTTDANKIFEDSTIDAVIIATPASTHYDLSKMALSKGKHVLVEKPMATNIRDANSLIKLAKKYKKALMPGHVFEYHDGIRAIKSYIQKRKLGKIFYMYSRRTNLGPIRNDTNAIWDLSLHDISIFNFFLDSLPVYVSSSGFSYLRKNIEDVGFVTLHYPNNIISHIHISWLDPRKVREITIIGGKKMLVFDDLDYMHPIKIYDRKVMTKKYGKPYLTYNEFRMIVKNGPIITPDIKIREPLKIECQEFISYILVRKIPYAVVKRGINAIKVLNTADKSLRNNGKRIKIQ